MKKFENINDLQLTHVNVIQAAIENNTATGSEIETPIKFKFDIGLRSGLDILANKAIVKVFIMVDVLDRDSVSTNITAKFDIDFLFNVSSIKDYITIKDEGGQIDSSLSGILLSTAYSTARGIIYTRCLGTVLGNVLIPIIPVQELMQIADKNLLPKQDSN